MCNLWVISFSLCFSLPVVCWAWSQHSRAMSLRVVPWPAATASPGNLLKMQILVPNPPPAPWAIESETLELRPSTLLLKVLQKVLMCANVWEEPPRDCKKSARTWLAEYSHRAELSTLPGLPAHLHPPTWQGNKLLLLETSVITVSLSYQLTPSLTITPFYLYVRVSCPCVREDSLFRYTVYVNVGIKGITSCQGLDLQGLYTDGYIIVASSTFPT